MQAMRVGTMLRRWRTIEEVGVRETAKQIGVSHGTLSRNERGEQMDAKTLIKLMAWMFSETNSEKAKRKVG